MHRDQPSAQRKPPTVIDMLLWPRSYAFRGGQNFWKQVLQWSERERLDCLLGLALLDSEICDRLVTKRDRVLLLTLNLSEETQESLQRITASTLKELAQAIVAASNVRYTPFSPSDGNPVSPRKHKLTTAHLKTQEIHYEQENHDR